MVFIPPVDVPTSMVIYDALANDQPGSSRYVGPTAMVTYTAAGLTLRPRSLRKHRQETYEKNDNKWFSCTPSVGNMDIQNTNGTMGPETMDKKITTIITRRGQWERGGRRSRSQRSHRSGCVTRMNKRFIMHSTRSEGTGSKVSQLIMQFIVPGKDKTTKRASKSMFHSEGVATAIAVRGEIWGDLA